MRGCVQKISRNAADAGGDSTSQGGKLAGEAVGFACKGAVGEALIVAEVQFGAGAVGADQFAVLVEEAAGAVLDGIGAEDAGIVGFVVGEQAGMTGEYSCIVYCAVIAVGDLTGNAGGLNCVEDQASLALDTLKGICDNRTGCTT